MSFIRCTTCNSVYPEVGTPYKCPTCDGIYDLPSLKFDHISANMPANMSGIWRYRHTFNLPGEFPIITLGEGDTPLVLKKINHKMVAFKLEYLNPTGSFKDRGTALLVSFLSNRGVIEAVEDSSGNAGASFAAYAASASIRAKIFIPDYASGPKKKQIQAYDAEIFEIPGPRANASLEVRRCAERGVTYASHAYLPFGIPGLATIAYELVEQIGDVPGSIILPVGQGSLLLGLIRGFDALINSEITTKFPKIIGVQAKVCAPLWWSFTKNSQLKSDGTEGSTIAEGVRILQPLRMNTIIELMKKKNGLFHVIEEKEILGCQHALAKEGFYVEPTSAIVWDALNTYKSDIPEPIVLILTGSGLKS